MRWILLLVLASLTGHVYAQETYYFVQGDQQSESSWQNAIKSTNFLFVDYESGIIKGKIDGNSFQGVFDLKVQSAGFVKGFNYSVELGYLQRDITPEGSKFENMTRSLTNATRFYVYPDNLINRNWNFLEIIGLSGQSKMLLVSKAQ